jgi:hypothetical protein
MKKPNMQTQNIVKIDSMKEVLHHINAKQDAIYFDIDDTIVTSIGFIGSEISGELLLEELVQSGMALKQALQLTMRYWQMAQSYIQMALIEPELPQILTAIKRKIAPRCRRGTARQHNISGVKHLSSTASTNHHSISYATARSPWLKDITYKQLKHLPSIKRNLKPGFDPQKITEALVIDNNFIFCGDTLKCVAISEHLQLKEAQPMRVMLVDNRMENLDAAVEHFRGLGMNFLGVHYDRVQRLNYHRPPAGCKSIKQLFEQLIPAEVLQR